MCWGELGERDSETLLRGVRDLGVVIAADSEGSAMVSGSLGGWSLNGGSLDGGSLGGNGGSLGGNGGEL